MSAHFKIHAQECILNVVRMFITVRTSLLKPIPHVSVNNLDALVLRQFYVLLKNNSMSRRIGQRSDVTLGDKFLFRRNTSIRTNSILDVFARHSMTEMQSLPKSKTVRIV